MILSSKLEGPILTEGAFNVDKGRTGAAVDIGGAGSGSRGTEVGAGGLLSKGYSVVVGFVVEVNGVAVHIVPVGQPSDLYALLLTEVAIFVVVLRRRSWVDVLVVGDITADGGSQGFLAPHEGRVGGRSSRTEDELRQQIIRPTSCGECVLLNVGSWAAGLSF